MSQPLLSDRLWAVIEPLIPPEPPKLISPHRACFARLAHQLAACLL